MVVLRSGDNVNKGHTQQWANQTSRPSLVNNVWQFSVVKITCASKYFYRCEFYCLIIYFLFTKHIIEYFPNINNDLSAN
jgi:hypothetical protein